MDKYGTLQFRYFTEKDYVITPLGYGIVVEDEKEIDTSDYFPYSEVLVQHKNGCGQNPGNKPRMMERSCVSLITREKYENDKD